MNKLEETLKQGQSIWLDFLRRGMLKSGELKKMVAEGVRGLTSNPSIFQKAVCESNDYAADISAILHDKQGIGAVALYEQLAVEDIRGAADILNKVYDMSKGTDGFVSLEASPNLAYDTQATLDEVRRLWKLVNRPNLLVKVPGTPQGISPVESLIAEGININITLLFSIKQYEETARAYIHGLEKNQKPDKVASVASFFVSRIDTMVDKALEKIGTPEALSLRGKTAVAYSKMVYKRFREIFYGQEFAGQRKRGARVQKLVWGSTSTKNPSYRDVLYVEELIGPDTVSTIPLETLIAFKDHGKVKSTLAEGFQQAEETLERIKGLGIDMDSVTEQLQKDGVASFAKAFDQLLAALKASCR